MPKNLIKPALIVDLDGTLCEIAHRLHFISDTTKNKDWKSFYLNMAADDVNEWCYSIIKLFSEDGVAILYVTGRPDTYKQVTLNWLRQNACPINGIYMRSASDSREDFVVKKEIYENEIKPSYNVLFCLEDRASVTKMWRSLGLVCLQCHEGNF